MFCVLGFQPRPLQEVAKQLASQVHAQATTEEGCSLPHCSLAA